MTSSGQSDVSKAKPEEPSAPKEDKKDEKNVEKKDQEPKDPPPGWARPVMIHRAIIGVSCLLQLSNVKLTRVLEL
jgi:hypothetical protein